VCPYYLLYYAISIPFLLFAIEFLYISHYSAVNVRLSVLKRFYALSSSLCSSVTYFCVRSLRCSLVSSPKTVFPTEKDLLYKRPLESIAL